jgi:hypothetical protein
MYDLPTILREQAERHPLEVDLNGMDQAADEIERLKAEVEELKVTLKEVKRLWNILWEGEE